MSWLLLAAEVAGFSWIYNKFLKVETWSSKTNLLCGSGFVVLGIVSTGILISTVKWGLIIVPVGAGAWWLSKKLIGESEDPKQLNEGKED
jgi:hypothetical protein